MSLLKEPVYNQLRTKEQLGYIVGAQKSPIGTVAHYKFNVQSNQYDADYLEHRINAFFEQWKDWEPSEAEVENSKLVMINKLKQKNTSLSSEATMNWGHILKEEFDFNLREQRIK